MSDFPSPPAPEPSAGPATADGYGPPPPQFLPPAPPKSRMAAGLLGIFLGGLGIHRFYLGYTNRGLLMLGISVLGGLLTCGAVSAGVGIWGLVEGILYLSRGEGFTTDATGRPLVD